LIRQLAVVAAAAIVSAGCGGARLADRRARPVDLLPDLVASSPSDVMVGTVYAGGRYHSYIGFNTRVTNFGAGMLDIVGHRRRGPIMIADQVVHRTGGRPRVVRSVAWLRFHGHGHDHWHLLPFADYQLIGADGRATRLRGRKQGFCIAGIRIGVGRPTAELPSVCGEHDPKARSVHERLAVRSADEYGRFAEGQSIPLDGVRAGRYYLVLRLNGTRRLRESDYSNNVATTLVRLGFGNGPATVWRLGACLRPPPCRPAAASSGAGAAGP
jgi:lysyl oxidase